MVITVSPFYFVGKGDQDDQKLYENCKGNIFVAKLWEIANFVGGGGDLPQFRPPVILLVIGLLLLTWVLVGHSRRSESLHLTLL